MPAIKDFIRYKDWYTIARHNINMVYQYPKLFVDLLAATSPRKQVKANLRLANKFYNGVLHGYSIEYILNNFNISGVLPNHIPNIKRAIAGKILSGEKIKSFAENLKGNMYAVTIDIWVLRYLRINRDTLTPKQYNDIAKRIKRNAKYHGLLPAEYQAVIWNIQRDKAGFNYRNFDINILYESKKLFN